MCINMISVAKTSETNKTVAFSTLKSMNSANQRQFAYEKIISKLALILVVQASILSTTKAERIFHNEQHFRENDDSGGASKENSPNLKHFSVILLTINEMKTNHSGYESKELPASASAGGQTLTFKTTTEKATTLRHQVNKNSSPASVYEMQSVYSKEADGKEANWSSSSVEKGNKAIKRIPPPSLMASSSAINATLRVCEIKYAEYVQRVFPLESDIASDANDEEFHGRVLAAPGEYPHMTAIGFPSYDNKMDYKCGGSLISENFVITAAHCTNFSGLQPSKVRIGDLNLMVEESYLEPQLRSIKNIYVHPDYRTSSYYNDIALLELAEAVHLTEFVRPIRLWTKETLPFTTAYAMGYGSTTFAKVRTNRLTNLNMTIVPNEECNREMPKYPQTEKGILSTQICARDFILNRDTCQGDSGGPLQLNVRGRKSQDRLHYHLIGVTSYGVYCRSGYPSIYTRVCSYLDWIEHIVWRDYFE